MLYVRLEDRFGNSHDPGRIRATVGNQLLALELVADEARIPVRFSGYGEVEVKLRDQRSKISQALAVQFAAAWLRAPKLIQLGSRFRTELHRLAGVDRQDPSAFSIEHQIVIPRFRFPHR